MTDEKKLSESVIPDDVLIDDEDVKAALDNMLKGRIMEKQAKQLIENAKNVLDTKLYSKHISRSHTDALNVVISEYEEKSFKKDLLHKYDPKVYEMFVRPEKRKRYLITPRVQ